MCDAPRGPASGRLDRAPRSGGAGSRGASGSVPRGPAALRRFAFPPPERGALTALRPPRHSLFSVAVVAVSSTSFHRFRAHGRRHAGGPSRHLRIPPGRRAADGHAAASAPVRVFAPFSIGLFDLRPLGCGSPSRTGAPTPRRTRALQASPRPHGLRVPLCPSRRGGSTALCARPLLLSAPAVCSCCRAPESTARSASGNVSPAFSSKSVVVLGLIFRSIFNCLVYFRT